MHSALEGEEMPTPFKSWCLFRVIELEVMKLPEYILKTKRFELNN